MRDLIETKREKLRFECLFNKQVLFSSRRKFVSVVMLIFGLPAKVQEFAFDIVLKSFDYHPQSSAQIPFIIDIVLLQVLTAISPSATSMMSVGFAYKSY